MREFATVLILTHYISFLKVNTELFLVNYNNSFLIWIKIEDKWKRFYLL